MKKIRYLACALAAGLSVAHAQPLPAVAPAAAGFSSEGLERLDRFFAREIEAKRVPGAVVAIARDGKLVHVINQQMRFDCGGACATCASITASRCRRSCTAR